MSSLRDSLERRLAALPNTTPLGLTVVASSPKRTTALFPHAPSSSVRCTETEYLVVVHCRLPPVPVDSAESASTAAASLGGQAPAPPGKAEPSDVLAAAISAHVYTLPTRNGVPQASIVYISKVDSSGYAASAGPVTRELAVGLLSHFLAPDTRPTPRVTATLFARSQGQYLFPNSVEGGGKRVLGGLGLCQWWKGVYEAAAHSLVRAEVATEDLKLRYLLPSYSAPEAAGMLRAPVMPPPVQWEYKPPFVHPLLVTDTPGLATLLPSLPDDPKTRFLEELVDAALDAVLPPPVSATTSSSSVVGSSSTPLGLTASTSSVTSTSTSSKLRHNDRERERAAAEDEQTRQRAQAALARVPAEEFWERIGFRQECASGDVTGFFSIIVEPQAPPPLATPPAEADTGKVEGPNTGKPTTNVEPRMTVPQLLVERILKSLLNTDFGTRALASAGTARWLESTRALVVDEIGEEGWASCTARVGAKEGVERAVKRKEEVVTMLQPRKKKR